MRFEICALDSRAVKAGDVEKALMAYVRATAPSERTATNQIMYWMDNIERSGLRFYGFRINGEIRGFLQCHHINEPNIVILDYLCVDPEFGTNAAYFAFLELFCSEVERNIAPLYLVTEIVLNLDDKTRDYDNRYWLRILELNGFKAAQQKYYHPSLDPELPENSRAGTLMIRSNETGLQISTATYIEIVKSVYIEHYIHWYAPFTKNMEKYQHYLLLEIERISEATSTARYIQLNGSLKHAGLVESDAEPPLTGGAAYYFIIFGLVGTIAMASSISAVALLPNIGPYVSIFIFLISLIIFTGIVAVIAPSRLVVLQSISEIAKHFSSRPK